MIRDLLIFEDRDSKKKNLFKVKSLCFLICFVATELHSHYLHVFFEISGVTYHDFGNKI